jgi:hypothetical protein
MAGRRWSDPSPRSRALIVVGGAVEASLKAAALTDLARRPAGEVRGPKWLWAVGLVLINSVGAAPLLYLLIGRRR